MLVFGSSDQVYAQSSFLVFSVKRLCDSVVAKSAILIKLNCIEYPLPSVFRKELCNEESGVRRRRKIQW